LSCWRLLCGVKGLMGRCVGKATAMLQMAVVWKVGRMEVRARYAQDDEMSECKCFIIRNLFTFFSFICCVPYSIYFGDGGKRSESAAAYRSTI
jgi:hypothetical protein